MRPAVLRLPLESRADVQRAVDTLTVYQALWLREHGGTPPLYDSGVRYEREPRAVGGAGAREDWQTIPQSLARGTADCEDLASWRAAETGGRAVVVRVPTGFHVVVRHPDGSVEDPSRELGMGREAVTMRRRRVRPMYMLKHTSTGGCVGYATDGSTILRARWEPTPEVAGRFGKRIKRGLKKLGKSKVLRGLAKAALQVAKLYPGTGQAVAALELGIKAAKAAKGALRADALEVTADVALQAAANAAAGGTSIPAYLGEAVERWTREQARA